MVLAPGEVRLGPVDRPVGDLRLAPELAGIVHLPVGQVGGDDRLPLVGRLLEERVAPVAAEGGRHEVAVGGSPDEQAAVAGGEQHLRLGPGVGVVGVGVLLVDLLDVVGVDPDHHARAVVERQVGAPVRAGLGVAPGVGRRVRRGEIGAVVEGRPGPATREHRGEER